MFTKTVINTTVDKTTTIELSHSDIVKLLSGKVEMSDMIRIKEIVYDATSIEIDTDEAGFMDQGGKIKVICKTTETDRQVT